MWSASCELVLVEIHTQSEARTDAQQYEANSSRLPRVDLTSPLSHPWPCFSSLASLFRGSLNWQSCLPPCPSASKLIITMPSQLLDVP